MSEFKELLTNGRPLEMTEIAYLCPTPRSWEQVQEVDKLEWEVAERREAEGEDVDVTELIQRIEGIREQLLKEIDQC